MTNYSPVRREYYFSDTYGDSSPHPANRRDADAILSTDFRSRPTEKSHEKFDIFHNSKEVDHLLRLIHKLHAEVVENQCFPKRIIDEFRNTITGIFINVAARTEENSNGDPFYVATTSNGSIRIVGTPITAFSAIKDLIEDFEVLPNAKNGLYSDNEQFRSSYTPVLLDPDHNVKLERADTNDIPDPDEHWSISYIDRFCNVITHASKKRVNQLRSRLEFSTDAKHVILNGVENNTPIYVAESLADAKPGEVSIYVNGEIDIARKWVSPNESIASRISHSAYELLGRPPVGTHLEIKNMS